MEERKLKYKERRQDDIEYKELNVQEETSEEIIGLIC